MSLLVVDNLRAGYGVVPVLHGISMTVADNEVVAVAGPNGAGKSTLLRAIFGLIPVKGGQVLLAGGSLKGRKAESLPRLGMALVPQMGGTFPDLSVEDNLRVSYSGIEGANVQEEIQLAFEMFPVLADRRKQTARTLSGGERQMLTFVSGIGGRPRFLALDEPTAGLAPTIVHSLAERIRQFQERGSAILWVVEENPLEVLPYADRVYVMRAGEIQAEMKAQDLLKDDALQSLFFGAAR